MRRVRLSVPPPGANGTMIRTALDGNDCAAPGTGAVSARVSRTRSLMLFCAGINVGPGERADALEEFAARRSVAAAFCGEASRLVLELDRQLAHLHELDDAVQYRRAAHLEDACVGEQHDHVAARGDDNFSAQREQALRALVELLDD